MMMRRTKMKIEFGELSIRDRFFDPFSGDFWVKLNEEEAELEYSGEKDSFLPTDEVIVDA
jgi:hypothetical protein